MHPKYKNNHSTKQVAFEIFPKIAIYLLLFKNYSQFSVLSVSIVIFMFFVSAQG